jgi:hypothetical protein
MQLEQGSLPLTEDTEFKRLRRIAGKRSIIAILANVPVITALWWGLANAEAVDAVFGRWSLVALCLSLLAFEGWLAFWVFGALAKHTNKSKANQA